MPLSIKELCLDELVKDQGYFKQETQEYPKALRGSSPAYLIHKFKE
jgi:hypothetical protein